jgi:hypothetical protein
MMTNKRAGSPACSRGHEGHMRWRADLEQWVCDRCDRIARRRRQRNG